MPSNCGVRTVRTKPMRCRPGRAPSSTLMPWRSHLTISIRTPVRSDVKAPPHSHDVRHATSMMDIMRMGAGTRAENKRESLDRILDAAARRIREEGLDGAAIVPVMRDAGLTHGAFYSHFSSKEDLAIAAF